MPAPQWTQWLAAAEEEVERILSRLPTALGAAARKVPVAFERRPDAALQEEGIEADTLGLFVGDSFAEATVSDLPLPPGIFLYLENLWEFAGGDERVYRRELRKTFLHELGHYLGLNELELEERGLD